MYMRAHSCIQGRINHRSINSYYSPTERNLKSASGQDFAILDTVRNDLAKLIKDDLVPDSFPAYLGKKSKQNDAFIF
jgi:hypothetical protein